MRSRPPVSPAPLALPSFARGLLLALLVLGGPGPAAAAQDGTWLEFDGGEALELPADPALDLDGGAFTLEAWIRPLAWGQNDQGRIFDHGGGSSGDSGWALHLENGSNRGLPATLRVQINDDSSFNGLADPGAITLGVWQHVAVTFDAGTLRFFVDGLPVGTRTGVPVPVARSEATRIGLRTTDTKRGFDGGIDDVRIWSQALSQGQIQARMGSPLSGSEPGLVVYYPLDEGAGQTAEDLGPNAIDGTLGLSPAPDERDPVWGPDAVNGDAVNGAWGPVLPWPHIAVSMANLPDGRVLTWSGSERRTWPSTE
ncbi:MAG: LamG domain-containing protein, partial [Myxococcota bacterium]